MPCQFYQAYETKVVGNSRVVDRHQNEYSCLSLEVVEALQRELWLCGAANFRADKFAV